MENVPNNMDLDPEMVMALREMCKANADPKVREIIKLREKAEHDEASRIQHALKTGREQGMKEGSYQQLVKTAQQLYSMGLDFGFISKVVDRPEEEIKRIIDGNRNN